MEPERLFMEPEQAPKMSSYHTIRQVPKQLLMEAG